MKYDLPVILLKGLVLLPYQEVRLELNNNISSRVVDISNLNHNSRVLVVCPIDEMEENPEVSDLPKVGVVGKIKTKIELPNGNFRVVIFGIERVKVNKYFNYQGEEDVLGSNVEKLILPKFNEIAETAKIKKLVDVVTKYVNNIPSISNSIIGTIKETQNIEKLTDMIASFVTLPLTKKLYYMGELNPLKRAEKLIKDLSVELEIVALDKKIDKELKKGLEKSQKEFVLKEKIKEIQKELGENNSKDAEVAEYIEKLNDLEIPEKTKNKLMEEIHKYELCSSNSPELFNIRTYIDTLLNLPWNKLSIDEINLKKIKDSLNKTHYGLDDIKIRIIEYIAMKKRNSTLNAPIICLVGPSGVGKTTLAISIAKALNKEFYKISVGGLNDSNELIGHRRTYLGATPGKIIQGIKKCNTKNPLILIDEVDKMVKDFKGDPASTLLDILDINQNQMFTDNYLEEPFDLSKVLFILTANNEYDIPYELRDRLEIINLSSYSKMEKLNIAKKYLIPNILENYKSTKSNIKISDNIIDKIIEAYTKEAGVRELERKLDAVIRKIIISDKTKKAISENDLITYLKSPEYEVDLKKIETIGIVNALAYTNFGGDVTPIEVCMYNGKEEIKCTGSLGKVMMESAEVALSYIKANLKEFKLTSSVFKDKTIHLHALTGGMPKDGPSAGLVITSALLSLLLKKKIANNISMSGEISLNGEIYEVGGIKEKIMAAYNNKITKIYLPKSNQKDIFDIPNEIKDKIKLVFVENYREIYQDLFIK